MLRRILHASVGPYSYDASPIEKIFATIKARDLNPAGRSFASRETADTYVRWLAEQIGEIDFGHARHLFGRALQACERYVLFDDI